MSRNLVELLRTHEGEGGRRRSTSSRRRWRTTGRSPTRTAAWRPSARGSPRRPSTASPPSTTTWPTTAAGATSRSAPAQPAGRLTSARTSSEAQERLGLALGERSEDGELSLGPTVCLGFCHTAGAVRDGNVVDAGPGAVERVASGSARAASEPAGESMLDEPVMLAPRNYEGLRQRARVAVARRAARAGQGGQRPRSRGRGLPGRHQVAVRPPGRRGRARHRGQRRRGRPGLVHRQAADGALAGRC